MLNHLGVSPGEQTSAAKWNEERGGNLPLPDFYAKSSSHFQVRASLPHWIKPGASADFNDLCSQALKFSLFTFAISS